MRVPQDEVGPRRTNQGPRNRSGPRWMNQGPVRRIRAPRDESGSRRTNQDPQDGSGPRRTNQGPMGRTRAFQDSGHTPNIVFFSLIFNLFLSVNLGPSKIQLAKSEEFLILVIPWAGAPHQVGPTQKKILRPRLTADRHIVSTDHMDDEYIIFAP